MKLIEIGKILKSHHLSGQMKIYCELEGLQDIIGEQLVARDKTEENHLLTLKSAKYTVDNIWIVTFEEITDMSQVEQIKGSTLLINSDFVDESEDIVDSDIVGYHVIDANTSENIGKVADVITTMAHDIIVVRDDTYEAMIPYIEQFVIEIDDDNEIIKVDLIDGLREPLK